MLAARVCPLPSPSVASLPLLSVFAIVSCVTLELFLRFRVLRCDCNGQHREHGDEEEVTHGDGDESDESQVAAVAA